MCRVKKDMRIIINEPLVNREYPSPTNTYQVQLHQTTCQGPEQTQIAQTRYCWWPRD